MKAVEADGSRFDRELWAELGSAGLLGLALPEEYDGAGLGLIELCRVLVEVGRTVAPVPLAAHGPAARLLAEHGSDAQKAAVAAGRGHRRQGPDRGGRRGARVRTRAADHDRDAGRRRLHADRQQGRRAGGPVRRRVPGAGGDAVRGGRVPGAARRPGRDRDRADVLRRRRGGPGRPRRRGRAPPTGWSARPTARSYRRLRHLLLLAGLRRAARDLRGRAGPHRGVRQDPRAVRPPDRHLPGGLAAAGRRLHRHARPAARRSGRPPGGWRRGCRPTPRSRSRSCGPPTPGTGSRTRPCTCTAASGIDLDGEAHRYFTSAKRYEFLHGGATEQALHIGRTLAAEPA